MAIANMQDLLDAGVHFGSHTSRWNPKMKPFIHGKRNNVHIVDIKQTLKGLIRAYKFLENVTASGKKVVFVGTKRQAQEVVRAEAARGEQYFVAQRWLGGTLTNIRTIRERVVRLEELEALETTGQIHEFSKKMISKINREKKKISQNFEGIRNMKQIPGAMVIIDPKNEAIALAEAIKLNIPVVALADTDCDPDPIDFLVPGNDDGIRSIQTIVSVLIDGCLSGASKQKQNAALEERSKATNNRAPAAR
jgi:small subunit ribosomal protein S2